MSKKSEHLWTADEREKLPEEQRTELIDGVLYDMAAPLTIHQDICMEIYNQIRECIRSSGKKCRVYLAPTDVCLDRDSYAPVSTRSAVCIEQRDRHPEIGNRKSENGQWFCQQGQD